MAKQKLLIFGDSFGEEFNISFHVGHPLRAASDSLLSYHTLLKESGYFSSIENYALGGCDLFTQYQRFLEKYTGDELVLWFLTNPNRITIDNIDHPGGIPFTIVGLNFCEFQLERIRNKKEPHLTKSAENIYAAAVEYYKYLQRDNYDDYVFLSIMNDIRKKAGKNVWFIPCFRTNATKDIDFALLDVFMDESNSMRYEVQKHQHKFVDIRRNHMTEANHRVLANQILDYYKTGKDIDPTLFVKPRPEEFSKYFRLRK